MRIILVNLLSHLNLRAGLLCGLLLLLAACTSVPDKAVRDPAEVRAQLVKLLPATLADREGWAQDIQFAFQSMALLPSTENLCAVLAVTEQESGYAVDPTVPGLGKIARQEIDRRAARLGIPQLAVSAALALKSADGRSYATRIAAVRTERDLSVLYEQIIDQVPLGKQLFARVNPVRTGGPMQVSIAFAEEYAARVDYPYPDAQSIRREVFSRRGGLYFGIAHLLDYQNSYTRHLYRFADFNAGWYASRNAAFQAAVSTASGVALIQDGDLVIPASLLGSKVGSTEAATRKLAGALDMTDAQIRRELEQGRRFEFEQSTLYEKVYTLAEQRKGRPLAHEALPNIRLESPKITRKLTTAWFANRVQERYQRCVNRALGN
ncbi:MAG: DUF1615 domain-containing protein [Moraxellaceae bacterium]|nr:DUF1615 domain-containing protein [Moraxellaceae bacterium]